MPGGKGNIKPKDNPKPFKKGENGGSNGRPKGIKDRSTILKKWLEVAAKVKNPETNAETIGTIEDKIGLSLIAKALTGDVQAIKEINDTLYGKIPDKTKLEGDIKGEITIIRKVIDGRNKD